MYGLLSIYNLEDDETVRPSHKMSAAVLFTSPFRILKVRLFAALGANVDAKLMAALSTPSPLSAIW